MEDAGGAARIRRAPSNVFRAYSGHGRVLRLRTRQEGPAGRAPDRAGGARDGEGRRPDGDGELDDGSGLLEGGGKQLRFIQLRSPADAGRAPVKRMVRKAFTLGGTMRADKRQGPRLERIS